ncbi:amino acid/amide ABC transporter membrane protein 1, HAAT family [Thermomonospora echinospora]|uniref:Amino acid/amide ABC transporter membrane protein 1, HAAT family n=1 Tax=Thermomonospora echinospora TaxID=1992 RepID=A0A1H6AN68_9ACTN|nr:branched-chain amino acid ABC transporter permease [Thermomonospora echinospora]SEG49517.1 amino acid/amide ABC transporter membrane protein 1, HAAT family [Thermomonospora echinospora]
MLSLLVGALVLSAIYALVGFAWVLLRRTNGILNLATGAQLALGAFIFNQYATSWGLPWPVVVLGTLATVVALGAVTHWLIFRKLAGQPEFALVVATLGLASALKGLSSLTWGTEARVMREPVEGRVVELLDGVSTTLYGIFGLVAALVVFAAAHAFFRYSTTGIRMRAAAENSVLASQGGIAVDWVYVLGWAIALTAAAIAGIMYAYQTTLSFHGVDALGLRGIAPALVGGLTSIKGVIPGALIIGLAETFGVKLFGGSAQDVAAWVVILVVLLIRPQGLFGEKQVERV